MVHFDLFVYIQTTKGQPKTVDVLVCVELHLKNVSSLLRASSESIIAQIKAQNKALLVITKEKE